MLVSVAVLRAPKGLDRAIAAVAQRSRRRTPTCTTSSWATASTATLRQAVTTHGVVDRVHFTGARTDVPDIPAACDVFVHPTPEDAPPTCQQARRDCR
ncbi:MAG: glycosyltransferase [Thermoleophilia bacterium]